MWPFEKTSKLPGVEYQANGQVSLTLTDEEENEVNGFFRLLRDSSQETAEGTWYIHPEARKAMTARALTSYAQHQISLADITNNKGVTDGKNYFRKALAASLKAYSFHSLPIYMFDMGCLFEMLGDTTSAKNAFRSFLESQRKFEPSDIDRITLAERDVEEAIKMAREKV